MAGLFTRLGHAFRPPMARPVDRAHTVNAAAGADAPAKPPKPGVTVSPRQRDHANVFSGDLTPDRVKQILAATIYGNAEQINAAFDRMIERDAHIQCEYQKRLDAVTGLPWDVVSMSQIREGDLSESEAQLADEIASFVRKSLTMIRVTGHNIVGTQPIEAGLTHLMDGVGRGLSCVEQEWADATVRMPGGTQTISTRLPVRWHCLASSRFRFDSNEPWRLRVQRDDGDYEGIALDEQVAGKFITHAPRVIGGNPFRGGLHVPALLLFLGKTYGWKWFMSAMELFGSPLLIAKYPPNATPGEVDAILEILEDIGHSGRGAFSATTSFEAISTGFTQGGTQTIYERMLKLADTAATKNYIGVTLLTDVSAEGGSRALGDNQQEVADDRVDSDIRNFGATMNEQYTRPIVAASPYAARGGLELLPSFIYEVEKPLDDAADMNLLDRAVNRFKNVKIPKRHVHERFGLPTTDDDAALDEPLEGAGGIDPFSIDGNGTDAASTANRRALRQTANRALDRILARRSPLASIGPWLIGAILASQSVTQRTVDAFDVALAPFNDVTLGVVAQDRVSLLPDDVAAALAEAFDAVVAGDSHADMVELNRQLLLATRLHGERTTQVKVERARSRNARTINAESIDFQRLPFVEAIESLRDRVGLDPETFIQLEADARSRAFRVAGVWDMDLLAVLHTNLVRTITNGETVRDFRLRVLPQMADRAGWTGENPWHSNVVFYQNFAMAHAAGRFRQYDDLEISYWRFTAHGDTCEICEPFVGKVYRTTDTRYVPPLHFFCDCIDEVVFDEELRDGELRSSNDEPPNPALEKYLAQPSAFKFDVRQYAALEPVRIDKYPAEFQPAFKRLADARGWSTTESAAAPPPLPSSVDVPLPAPPAQSATPESGQFDRVPSADAAQWKDEIGKTGRDALRDYKGLLYFNDLIAIQKRGEEFATQQLIDKLGRGQKKNIGKKIQRAKEILNGLDEAWAKRPVDTPQTLYRGISNLTAEQARQIAKSGEVQWTSWTSTTKSTAIAEMFGRYNPLLQTDREWVQFKIQSRSGMPLEAEGFLAREQEVLQRHGTRLRVVESVRVTAESGNPGWEVTLQEI